ncbi:MAG TPA: TetR family transcriptional regulator C-terminal domain-containing protein [Steroidobacteraceae bacterium]|nr:TetR family transcriptional regulator C-terminal domain-containing protein [Steroidobacteraceae bacterium]
MAKPSNRDKLLTEGLRVVHERGFAGAGVRDIVAAAGVPQGSFTNHFASKEAFGLEIINLYFSSSGPMLDSTLRNAALTPLARVRAYVDANMDRLNETGMRNGCLFGNFIAEASEHSEAIRQRIVAILAGIERAIAVCLREAVAARELPRDFECDEIAAFVMSGLQGATLLAKAQRSPQPMECFKHTLFTKILNRP